MIRGAFIGIDRHADPFIGDLTGAAREATALWAVLSDNIADRNAPLITDGAATLVAMLDALDSTLSAADEEDVVIFRASSTTSTMNAGCTPHLAISVRSSQRSRGS